jgi:hypothetical protein
MADEISLLVPIHVDALLVNALVASNVPFERWANAWANLNSFNNPIPAPWGGTSPAALGVHLHWQLPSALTHGVAPAGSTDVVFPHTPNRWIVVRLAAAALGSAPQNMTAWIIESDFTNPETGTTPYIDPKSSPTDLQTTLLGRNVSVAQWEGESSPSGTLFLKATGIAQTSFLAYQPGLVDVYSFFDDTTALPDGTVITYLVAGWYSNAAFDPLVLQPAFDPQTGIFTDLNWTALGLAGQNLPTRSVFHGLVNDLLWQTQSIPQRVDSNTQSMQVAVGYTAIDALSSVLAQMEKSSSPTPEQIEMMLAAFQYDSLSLLDEPDATAQLELRIRRAWFGSTPGGTLWQIVPVAQGQSQSDPLTRVVQPPPVPLSSDQETWLATLNTSQRALDIAQRELMTLQWELFSLWWKTQYAAANLMPDGLSTWGIDATQVLSLLSNQLDPTQSASFISEVSAKQSAVAEMQGSLPIPTSPDSIQQFSKQIPGNTGNLTLKPNALPSFNQPADPVLLVAGITPPVASPDNSQALPCRVSSAATTGVNVVAAGTTVPVSSSTGKLAGIMQQPGALPAKSGQPLSSLLDPAVAAGIAALSTEAFFADPNNAQSIAVNGLNNSDVNVIAALQAAMGSGTAQIATIPNPLQATFAFGPWQQAWAPLYVEWNLQFYPTVETSFTGQALPVQPALTSGAQPVQDNLPMNLAAWSFNGSSNVFARGSEYYSWTGGDIWNQNNWLVPQTFQGRSSLTPNAETLFLARLKEFISKQPVVSALAVVTGGAVTAVTLQSGGAGYSQAPQVTFSGGSGSGVAATAEVADGAIISITVTNSGSGYTTPPQVVIGPGDWAAIQSLIDAIGDTRFLSQTLSGFNDNFLMKQAVHTLAPDENTANVIGGENRGVPNPGLGNVPIKFGTGQPFFFPVRGGYFRFLQLQIVDGFGQVLDLLQANGNPTGNPMSFQPILGAGMAPESTIASSTYQVKQAPRVVQPSRINLRWLDSANDSEEVFLSPGADPMCGWLIPNHLDHSIAVYNAAGVPLGELLVLMQTGGSEAVVWLPAPDSPGAISDPADIENPHLRVAISAFTATTGGIPVAERVDAFRAWFNSIDETLWTVDPPGGQSDAALAVLIGRPLAMVRLQVGMELFGRPAYNQSWRDTFDISNPADPTTIEVGQQEAGFTTLDFPIQLGSTELLQDGTIGYFANDVYTAFNAVHAASSPVSPYINLVGGPNVLSLPFNYPNYSTMNLTVLMDPLGTMHATTGALPVAELSLPAQFYATVLSNMAVSFRIGPVLADPAAIRVPVPTEQRGNWSWVWQSAPGSYESEGVIAATAQARLADAPPHLMDGWLVLTPPKPKKT